MLPPPSHVVFAGAKILIFQQITTYICHQRNTHCCFCWCKDTNFSANHNIPRRCCQWFEVVFAGAKILIFQQITTIDKSPCHLNSCFCWCKDTNFSANHNHTVVALHQDTVVFAGAKILIFQQITT